MSVAEPGEGVITLDVSGLEPPEPLVHALDALQTLPPGHCLQMIHRMRPGLLYGEAAKLGFDSDTRRDPQGQCRVFFWRRGDREAEATVRRLAAEHALWSDRE